MWLKRGLSKLYVWILLGLSVILTGCEGDFSGIEIWNKVLWFGRLEWLGLGTEGPLAGFLRIAIFILVFALLYGGSRFLTFIPNNIRIVIAFILALISVVMIPGQLLTAIAASYGIVVSFVLIGALIFAGGAGLMYIPTTNIGWRILRIVLIILLLYIIIMIRGHAKELLDIGPITITGP